MAGVSTAEFTLTPQGDQTQISWAMTGKNNFFARAFGLFVSMDRMIGRQFEKGLTDLNSVARAAAHAQRVTPKG